MWSDLPADIHTYFLYDRISYSGQAIGNWSRTWKNSCNSLSHRQAGKLTYSLVDKQWPTILPLLTLKVLVWEQQLNPPHLAMESGTPTVGSLKKIIVMERRDFSRHLKVFSSLRSWETLSIPLTAVTSQKRSTPSSRHSCCNLLAPILSSTSIRQLHRNYTIGFSHPSDNSTQH